MAKHKRGKRFAATFFGWLPAAFAATFKGFTYTFGTLTLFNILMYGAVGITTASLSTFLFPISLALGVSVTFISLGMEGRKLAWRLRCFFLGEPTDKVYWRRWKIDYKQTWGTPSHLPSALKWILGIASATVGVLMPVGATLAKGLSGVAATFSILLFICQASGMLLPGFFSGPAIALWVVAGIAGFALGSVCLGKEAWTFNKLMFRFSDWLWGKDIPECDQVKLLDSYDKDTAIVGNPKAKGAKWDFYTPNRRRFIKFVSAILPTLAAIAKIFTYTFGALTLLNFIATGAFLITSSVLSTWMFPVACALGLTLLPISLGMEGQATYKKIKRGLYKLANIFESNCKDLSKPISRVSNPVKYWLIKLVAKPFLHFMSVFAPVGTALAKGASGAGGTMATLFFVLIVSGVFTANASPLIVISVFVAGGVAFLTLGSISLGKEGAKWFNTVQNYMEDHLQLASGAASKTNPTAGDCAASTGGTYSRVGSMTPKRQPKKDTEETPTGDGVGCFHKEPLSKSSNTGTQPDDSKNTSDKSLEHTW